MTHENHISQGVKDLLDTLGVLEMAGRKTIKIADVRYFLESTDTV